MVRALTAKVAAKVTAKVLAVTLPLTLIASHIIRCLSVSLSLSLFPTKFPTFCESALLLFGWRFYSQIPRNSIVLRLRIIQVLHPKYQTCQNPLCE